MAMATIRQSAQRTFSAFVFPLSQLNHLRGWGDQKLPPSPFHGQKINWPTRASWPAGRDCMSVRKRVWETAKGELREAWIVDYSDVQGERHIRTFDRKKEADAFHASVTVDVAAGTHTAAPAARHSTKPADLWIAACEPHLERTTVNSYRQHLDLHIVPYLGKLKLSGLTTPLVRKFEDDFAWTASTRRD